ncbi:MAG: hypothetical protein KF832_03545 [Caldilineaceae bacterium]|nr:hypothetical protein [Caldilineaceae bacterium]
MLRVLRILSPYLLMLTLVMIVGFATYRWTALGQEAARQPEGAPAATAAMLYMPYVSNDYNPRLAPRIGYGTSIIPMTQIGNVRQLNAGWYVDWGVTTNPVRPSGMEYMPMVRVHQKLDCPFGTTADRKICPYQDAYEYSPEASVIQAFAQANPGSTWLLGNEMDRLDWPGGRQDEILPTLYPKFYKEVYDLIKAADPTAKVAIGGVIQPTQLRLKYLTTIWDTYKQLYGVEMPVDVWNVHNFINAEFCHYESGKLVCYGSGVPPGATVLEGAYYGEDWQHINRNVFDKQIRNMRQWMKERGQQQKPLIVTEYGVLYTAIPCSKPNSSGGCDDPNWVDLSDPQVIHDFMLWTFDYFADTSDCTIGYEADGCRLVQRWAWFSLEDVGWNFNAHGALFDRNTGQPTTAGELYRQYTLDNYSKLQ